MEKKLPQKSVNSPRKQPSLPIPTSTQQSVCAVIFEWGKEEDSIFVLPVDDGHFQEKNSSNKAGTKNNKSKQYALLFQKQELLDFLAFIKKHENLYTAEEMNSALAEKDKEIETLKKTIGYLNSSSTVGLVDNRTFLEKNVTPAIVVGFAAGVALVSGIWLYHLNR